MELLTGNTNIDFMGKRKLALTISLALIVISLAALAIRGLNFGIDFTGGTVIEIGYSEPAELDVLRAALEKGGYERAVVQHYGTSQDVLIRLASTEGGNRAELSTNVMRALEEHGAGKAEMRRIEFVGPQVGEELREDGGLAMLYALVGILLYVALRFEYRFSFGAVIALVHDVIITIGFFAVTQVEFDLTVLAAILAVIGYSLNDTIVVYDRVRENFRKIRKGTAESVINTSVNQTLSRTVMTSLTTLLVLVALLLLGGEILRAFSIALIVGVLIGTYSSIYIASTAVLMMGVSKADLMPVKKEGAELEDKP